MKGAYKRKGKRNAAQSKGHYGTRRRDRMRQRRVASGALLGLLLLAVVGIFYLFGDRDALQVDLASESVAGGEAETASQEEAAPEGVASGESEASGQPSVLLGEFFTDYAWDPDPGRQSNLRTAAEAIDGTVLKPGEEFSALAVLEPLEYEPAKVFANGGVDYTEGGGLCQISSTLFMAANYAGLEIVERNPHYAELPYIRPGFDATVWFGENGWGALDMKIKNNTDGDILIRQFVNDKGFLVAEIYGEEPTGKVVSMNSERIEEDPNKGIKWATYKTVTDNGKTVEDGQWFETVYSYNPPTPPELKHETHEPRGSGWVDTSNTTNWNDKD